MKSKSFALVTGASSGVGIDFARELAQRGYDLVLTARRADRLTAVQKELQNAFGVRVETLTADLRSTAGARQLFADAGRLGPISVLINNAGLGKFGGTLEQSVEDLETTIQVNVTSLTVLARLFGEEMARRKEGYILNNASFSAIQPVPSYSVYSGTKAYVLAFSQALRQDLRPHGVRVSALCPGFFRSEFHDQAGQVPSPTVHLLMMSSESVARAGIRGLFDEEAVIIPDWRYKLLNLMMRALPRTAASWLAEFSVRH
jgi:short-subunit dehydrogenase